MNIKTLTIGLIIGIVIGGGVIYIVTPSPNTLDQDRLEELETAFTELNNQNDAIQRQNNELQTQIITLQTQIADLETIVDDKDRVIESMSENEEESTPTPIEEEEDDPLVPQPTTIDLDNFDKMSLWDRNTGPHLRGANIWQHRIYDNEGGVFWGPEGSTIGTPYTQDDLNRLASFGANYVLISHAGIYSEEAPYELDVAAQTNLDNVLEKIEKADMFAVISFRSGPGRSNYAISEPGSDDYDSWDEYRNHMWDINDPETAQYIQDKWVEMWTYTANRYKDNKIVVGYELMVEPTSNVARYNRTHLIVDKQYWNPEEFYEKYEGTILDLNRLQKSISEGIRTVDPDTPILVGGNSWSSIKWLSGIVPTGDERTVYVVHQYEPQRYSHSWPHEYGKALFDVSYPDYTADVDWDGRVDDFDKEWLNNLFTQLDDFSETHDVNLGVTEFGVFRWSPGAAEYLEDEYSLFEERGINTAIWEWYSSWEPFAWNDDTNYLHGTSPPEEQRHYQEEELPNELVDVLLRYWALNNIRPSDIN